MATSPKDLMSQASDGDVAAFDGVGGFALRHVVAVVPVTVKGKASQTANLTEWTKSDDTVYSTVSENGYYTTRKVAAPADAELAASEAAFWFDATNGAGKLMVKAKTADGTVVTGSITLT